jgi:hypothetical protein
MNNGKTIGTRGSEGGVIVLDDEHTSGARISLERGCSHAPWGSHAPWAVTCGIYGGFLHTAFASSEAEGRAKYSAMKPDLEDIMVEEDNEARYNKMKRFADVY